MGGGGTQCSREKNDSPQNNSHIYSGYVHMKFSDKNDLHPHRRFHIIYESSSIHAETSVNVYHVAVHMLIGKFASFSANMQQWHYIARHVAAYSSGKRESDN